MSSSSPSSSTPAEATVQLSKSQVYEAIKSLIAKGQAYDSMKLRQIHAALGYRGSLETVSKHYRKFGEEHKDLAQAHQSQDEGGDHREPSANSGARTSDETAATHPAPRGSDPVPAWDHDEDQEVIIQTVAGPVNLRLASVPGPMVALLQNNFVAQLQAQAEGYEREAVLRAKQSEAEVARARAEASRSALDRHVRFSLLVGGPLLVVAVIAAALVGHRLGTADAKASMPNREPVSPPATTPAPEVPSKAPPGERVDLTPTHDPAGTSTSNATGDPEHGHPPSPDVANQASGAL